MRKKSILVGVICLLVAGGGAAATKMTSNITYMYYYEEILGDPSTCETVVLNTDPSCDTGGIIDCDVTVTDVGVRQLYVTKEPLNNFCLTPLSKE
ncbi:hypothetical protein [Dinghuibacter silviterrae]|uniref:DUF4333 domain-containing protein n=1 Tax=Dinghuibacter silviterrae TaxID=1539049 RepID=A0A4R8DST9_9BACT|nr:hypothetical protein [Dinghuibacter silviterrae]TDX00475.1 hypothetical protein EDB95_1500 [Dinghuibacter silviterrae]